MIMQQMNPAHVSCGYSACEDKKFAIVLAKNFILGRYVLIRNVAPLSCSHIDAPKKCLKLIVGIL
jgi:hypothetical protein